MSQPLGLLTAATQLALTSLIIKPHRALGSMSLQVTLEESHQDDLEITDHPIEKGAAISDHAFKRPAEVTIKGAWSASPADSGLIDGVIGGLSATISGAKTLLSGKPPTTMVDTYAQLLALQKNVVPFDIYTGKRKYSNMLIRSLSVSTDKSTENCLMITAVCREVLLVSTQVLAYAVPVTNQADPGATASPVASGTKNLTLNYSFSVGNAGRGSINPP